MMNQVNMEEAEFAALQQEKRDRMNARWQVWSLLFALISGFGLAGVQSGDVSYLVALYPLIATCIARLSAHSERVLDQVKAYLIAVEIRHDFKGYEWFNLSSGRKGVGSHQVALRDALFLTENLAAIAAVYRFYDHGLLAIAIIAALLDAAAIVATLWYLRKPAQISCPLAQEKGGTDGNA